MSARGRRREAAYARRRGLSLTKACEVFHVARSMMTYTSRLDDKDAVVIDCMAALSQANPRYGYRRVRVLLGREGKHMSARRAHRLWNKAGLQVPKKRRRRVPVRTARPTPANGANHVWCYDFVHDACANGQQFKCLTVVDEYTRECLAIDVASSIRSERVIAVLARSTGVRPQRQWSRVHRPGRPGLAEGRGHRDGLHRARQALAERPERCLLYTSRCV